MMMIFAAMQKLPFADSISDLDSMELAAIIFSVLLTITFIGVAVVAVLCAKQQQRRRPAGQRIAGTNIRMAAVDPQETMSANYIAGLRLDDPVTITESVL